MIKYAEWSPTVYNEGCQPGFSHYSWLETIVDEGQGRYGLKIDRGYIYYPTPISQNPEVDPGWYSDN